MGVGGVTKEQLASIIAELQNVVVTLASLDVTINAGDIEIGAVEIKDATTDTRRVVTEKENILAANDVVETHTYLDPGAADERISTIVYHSATIHSTKNAVATYAYAGVPGGYYIATVIYTLVDV